MNCAFPDKPLGLTTSYRRLKKMKDVVSDVKRKILQTRMRLNVKNALVKTVGLAVCFLAV